MRAYSWVALALLLLLVIAPAIAAAPTRNGNQFTWNTTDKNGVKAILGKPDRIDLNLSLSRWDGEVGLTLVPVIPAVTWTVLEQTGDKVTVSCPGCQMNVSVYPLSDGLEYELVLRNKPPSNILTFSVESRGLVWYYQDELWKEFGLPFVDNGTMYACNATYCWHGTGAAVRPEKVVGSYQIHRADGKTGGNYQAGKFASLDRTLLTDAKGATSWAVTNLSPDGKTLTITTDAAWLNAGARKYPIIVDPFFGYSTLGGSHTAVANTIEGSKFTLSEDGTLLSITWAQYPDAGFQYAYAIYDSSLNLKANTTPRDTVSSPPTWYTVNTTTTPCLSAGDYWLVIDKTEAADWIYYDGGSANQGLSRAWTFGTWENPLAPDSYNTNKYSVYVEYQPATCGGGGEPPVAVFNATNARGKLLGYGMSNASHRNETITLQDWSGGGQATGIDFYSPNGSSWGGQRSLFIGNVTGVPAGSVNVFPHQVGGWFSICMIASSADGRSTYCLPPRSIFVLKPGGQG